MIYNIKIGGHMRNLGIDTEYLNKKDYVLLENIAKT